MKKNTLIKIVTLLVITLNAQEDNTLLGNSAGLKQEGNYNTYIGAQSGYEAKGSHNVYLGYRAGRQNTGNNNIFIGWQANYRLYTDPGINEQLIIESNNIFFYSRPLIWGSFAEGKRQVGINTQNVPDGYTLGVSGKIITEGVRVNYLADWPDYVFEEGYQLKDLEVLEAEIKQLGHLPNVPSAKKVMEEGIDIAEINKILLEKIEELTLYTIEQEKRSESQEKRLRELEKSLIENQENTLQKNKL